MKFKRFSAKFILRDWNGIIILLILKKLSISIQVNQVNNLLTSQQK